MAIIKQNDNIKISTLRWQKNATKMTGNLKVIFLSSPCKVIAQDQDVNTLEQNVSLPLIPVIDERTPSATNKLKKLKDVGNKLKEKRNKVSELKNEKKFLARKVNILLRDAVKAK